VWTDEQLLEQGWTREQIDVHRTEQAITSEVVSPVENEISQKLAPVVESIPSSLVESKDVDIISESTGFSGLSPGLSAIMMAAILVIVPFSLYSISTAEGTQGEVGNDGGNGVNGTDGSSFHLVESTNQLPSCDSSINNQIFFVASQSGFQICQNNVWSIIDLTGPSGLNGTAGTDGTNGTNGTDGTNGNNGQNGADGNNGNAGQNGLSSLIVSKIEPNGVNCPTGGTLIETGIDYSEDNILSPDEVESFIFVCNGDDGNDGNDGSNGSDGSDGADGVNGSSTTTMMVARLSIAPANLGCNGTGQLFQQGIDNGAGNGIAQNGILESGEILFSTLICTTFSVDQVHDINPGSVSSNPSNFVTINSTMYFTANNGTASGIWSLDVNDNLTLEYSGSVLSIRVIGSQLMFAGQDSNLNVKPYVFEPSNGTAWQITEIFPGGSSYPGEFTLIGTTVFFSARDSVGSTGIGMFDLWAYEILNYSVWKVEADIQPSSLIDVNSDLYFSAQPQIGVTGIELWKHDTSTNTTFMVKDINPGVLSSSPQYLVAKGTTIYMSANAGTTHGTELYAYETTNNSAWLAADIQSGFAGSSPSELVVLGTRVYFQATSGTHFEMWVYESQNNSFWKVTDIQSASGAGGPTGLTVHEYTVYFSADDGTNGDELWAHNSINETTWLVIDLHPSGGSVGDIQEYNGHLYFSADDGTDGLELWKLIFSKDVTYV